MTSLSNPHDHFFRAMFARAEVAADFVRHYLPPALREHLDLTALHAVKGTFVDDDLRDHFTDLLFQTQLQDQLPGYVYLLFEHKSYPDTWTAFQLLRYMVRIWEHVQRQQHPTTLPPIIPLVVYHGTTSWQIDDRFQGLVTAPAVLSPYIPDFRYAVCDLADYSDADLRGTASLQVTLLFLKHIFDEDWGSVFPSILPLLVELAHSPSGLALMETALRYATAAAPGLQQQELAQALMQAFPEDGGALMQTIAQTWIEQGLEQGLEQGIEQGMQTGMTRGAVQTLQEAVLELLEVRFGRISVAVATTIMTLEDLPRLKTLHKQAATVASLAEFEQLLT